MIKILLVDDHKILREGLRNLLTSEPGMVVVGEASNGQEALQLIDELQPDIVLLDIEMPVMNGLEATKKIKGKYENLKVLILSQYDSEEYLSFILQAGGSGYVLKETASTELIWAIKTVYDGLAYLSPAMAKTIIQEYLTQKDFATKTKDVLSLREQEVFHLIADGYDNRSIANELCISLKTVQSHKAHIMEKLNLSTRMELMQYAIRKRIVSV